MINPLFTPFRSAFIFSLLGILICLIFFFLRSVLLPLTIAYILAYLFDPFIQNLANKKFSRTRTTLWIIFITGFCVFLFLYFLVPVFIDQVQILFQALPSFINLLDSNVLPKISKFLKQILNVSLEKQLSVSEIIPQFLENPVEQFLGSLTSSTRFLFSTLFYTLLVPIFFFFISRDFKRLKKGFFSLIPEDLRKPVLAFATLMDKTFRSVIKGQVFVVAIMIFLYSVAFMLSGLPAPLVVGLFTGIARFVPYLDVITGLSLCFFVMVSHSVPMAVVGFVALSFVVVQMVDGLYLNPRIMGQFSVLPPIFIILSIICFGDWFGFYGVLVAVPCMAMGKVIVISLIEYYKHSNLYYNKNT